MTKEEVYSACNKSLKESNFLLIEAATGFGKSKLSIDLINQMVSTNEFKGKKTSLLLLVAKTVHKQTWKEEINKWGGLHVDTITMECYESLKKYEGATFDFILMDECHHIKSDTRLTLFNTIHYSKGIGLSATIPKTLKFYFNFYHHAKIVSCNLIEAINDKVLPKPRLMLMPLQLDNTKATETIEINSKVKGTIYKGTFKDIWTYIKLKKHAIISCTQKEKLQYINTNILKVKKSYMLTRNDYMKNRWLFLCGERLKYLANLKNDIVLKILKALDSSRTITFCKTIEQAEILGKYCIHSKNKNSIEIYNKFNKKLINHITSVNILNENANLIDCQFAIFANYSSSEIIGPQRIGRALRHKDPFIILPYYKNTREEEIVEKMFEDYDKDDKNYYTIVSSIQEILNYFTTLELYDIFTFKR